jgi:hypothetical protein
MNGNRNKEKKRLVDRTHIDKRETNTSLKALLNPLTYGRGAVIWSLDTFRVFAFQVSQGAIAADGWYTTEKTTALLITIFTELDYLLSYRTAIVHVIVIRTAIPLSI